jgi:hypothetical protein
MVAQLNYLSFLQEMDNQKLQAVESALIGSGIGAETNYNKL